MHETPWIADDGDSELWGIFDANGSDLAYIGGFSGLEFVPGDYKRSRSVATLMAAAPDLLGALIEMRDLKHYDRWAQERHEAGLDTNVRHYRGEISATAIAIASGETPNSEWERAPAHTVKIEAGCACPPEFIAGECPDHGSWPAR